MAGETDDPQLMTRYATGDIPAFATVYARHKGPLYRYFFRQCEGPEIADELFQEVWLRIIQARERYDSKAPFVTYMYQIAHDCLLDYLRKMGRSPALPDSAADAIPEEVDPAFASARWSLVDWQKGPADGASGPEAASSGEQRAARFRSALDALPTEQREAFLLHEEAAMGLADIAAVTGANAEAVKSRLRAALKRLRGTFGDLAPSATPGGPG